MKKALSIRPSDVSLYYFASLFLLRKQRIDSHDIYHCPFGFRATVWVSLFHGDHDTSVEVKMHSIRTNSMRGASGATFAKDQRQAFFGFETQTSPFFGSRLAFSA